MLVKYVNLCSLSFPLTCAVWSSQKGLLLQVCFTAFVISTWLPIIFSVAIELYNTIVT